MRYYIIIDRQNWKGLIYETYSILFVAMHLGNSASLNQKRKKEGLSYFSFFTEKWANFLGEHVTGEKSMENLVID